MTISGTYFNGKISLDSTPSTSKPMKVKIIFESESEEPISLADYSFSSTQELLKDVPGSFADEVVRERRSAR